MKNLIVPLLLALCTTAHGMPLLADSAQVYTRTVSTKHYELKDHLGNIRAVVSDVKEPVNAADHKQGFTAQLLSSSHYDAFGMEQADRSYASAKYRYGFNGKEKDDEWKGSGNSYDFDARIYDPRVGRWLSTDPLSDKFPDQSPYDFAFNSPVKFVDPDGREPTETCEAEEINDSSEENEGGLSGVESNMTPVDDKFNSSNYYQNPNFDPQYIDTKDPKRNLRKKGLIFAGVSFANQEMAIALHSLSTVENPPLGYMQSQAKSPGATPNEKPITWYSSPSAFLNYGQAVIKACVKSDGGVDLQANPTKKGYVVVGFESLNGPNITRTQMNPLSHQYGDETVIKVVAVMPCINNPPFYPVVEPVRHKIGAEAPTAILLYKAATVVGKKIVGTTLVAGSGIKWAASVAVGGAAFGITLLLAPSEAH